MDEEDILSRHRQEKKDLQAKIVGLKKNLPKNDKKRKKETMDEIARMEHELKEKHEKELDELHRTCFGDEKTKEFDGDGANNGGDPSNDLPAIDKLSINDAGSVVTEADKDGEEQFTKFYEVRGISKAQRKKEKKAEKAKEKLEKIEAESKELYETSKKKMEADTLKVILDNHGYCLYDIPSDGDCLFKAIEHQLSLRGIKTTVPELRKKCANELKRRQDEFLPFLINPDNDDLMDDDKFIEYCDKIEKTKYWGGNLELQALSYSLALPIKVLQATGPSIDIGLDRYSSENPLILSYHRHAYQLGEHYNSVIPSTKKI